MTVFRETVCFRACNFDCWRKIIGIKKVGILENFSFFLFSNYFDYKNRKRKGKRKKSSEETLQLNDCSGTLGSCIIVLSIKCINIFSGSKVETNFVFKKDHIPSVTMRWQSSVMKIPSTTLMYCKADIDQTSYYYDVLVPLSILTSRYRALSKK